MVAKRYPTQETAHIEVYGHVGLILAKMKDISKTGACLEVFNGAYNPQIGDLLNLTVILNSLNRRHNFSAEVVWQNDSQVGVCFISKDTVLDKMMAKNGV